MTDIVERLRDTIVWDDGGGECELIAMLNEAADEIERLRALSQNNAHSWDTIVRERNKAADEIERLRAALESITKNTCCDRCQEAALVARAALTDSSSAPSATSVEKK
jgi:RNase P subunit RPR2